MKKEIITCDLCKIEWILSNSNWWERSSPFQCELKKDGINGGYNFEHLCYDCRVAICSVIDHTIMLRKDINKGKYQNVPIHLMENIINEKI